MTNFTTMTDVQQYVLDRIESYDISFEVLDRAVDEIAQTIRDAAHDAGLRYEDDWSEVIEDVMTLEYCCDVCTRIETV